MKLLFENWRKFLLTEKLMIVADPKNPNGWPLYGKLVAKAYEDAPIFDESAAASFEALEPFVHKMFDRIVGFGIDIDFVDDNPYENSKEMCRDVSENKVLRIWKGGTEHQIFDAKTNLKLRAVHDYMAHCQGGTSFGLQGEIASYNRHMKTVPPSAAGALFTEVVGQAAFFLDRGYFPPQKIAILEGFDFFNVGDVDPEITGYKLDPEKKELVKVEENVSELDPEIIKMIEEYVEMPIRNINIESDGTVPVQLTEEYDDETMEEIKIHWRNSEKYKKLKHLGVDVQLVSKNIPANKNSFSITKELL